MRGTWSARLTMVLLASTALVPLACGRILGLGDPQPLADGTEPTSTVPASPGTADPQAPPEELDAALPPLGMPDAACGDTRIDSKHCGACGRDCLGGTCAAGRCEPHVIAAQQGQAEGIAVNRKGIFWSAVRQDPNTYGVIRSCPLAGCTAAPRLVHESASDIPARLLVNDLRIYFDTRTHDRVFTCAVEGCAGPPRIVAEGLGGDEFILTPTQLAYVAKPVTSGEPLRVRRCALSACPSARTVIPSTAPEPPVALAGDALGIYVSVSGQQVRVLRCSTTDTTEGCANETTLWSAKGITYGKMVASANRLVFTAYDEDGGGGQALYICGPLPACAGGPRVLLRNFDFGRHEFAIDDRYVYWASEEYSALFRARLDVTSPRAERLLTGQGRPRALAAHEGVLYFTRNEFADVVRYVPPP